MKKFPTISGTRWDLIDIHLWCVDGSVEILRSRPRYELQNIAAGMESRAVHIYDNRVIDMRHVICATAKERD